MTGLVPPEVVAVPKGLVTVAAYEGRLRLGLLLYNHRTTAAAATSSARPATHVVFEEVSRTDWGLLVERDGKNRLLIQRLRVEQRQKAVLRDLMLVVEGFIGLLGWRKTRILKC